MSKSLLKNWTNDDFLTLEKGVILANHGLPDTAYFSDEALAKLLDNHPDEHLTISTMGADPTKFEWVEGERNGASGAEIIRLVQEGRLWLNLRNVLDFHPHIAAAVDEMYGELEAKSPGFKAQDRSANLLVSSSTAMVHYHVDMPVNMLWHIRGRKRVWVYPHFDYRFVSQTVIEKVCAGKLSEDVPYDPSFDQFALTFDVEPGQLLTWPQLTPHRVKNLGGLCVSLSTEHKNPRARRRINVHEANYFLRNTIGQFCKNSDVDGINAQAKQFFNRVIRLGKKVFGQNKETFVYTKSFKVNPSVPGGIEMMDVDVVLPSELQEA